MSLRHLKPEDLEQNQAFLEPEKQDPKPTGKQKQIPNACKSEDQKEQEEECKPDPKLEDPKPQDPKPEEQDPKLEEQEEMRAEEPDGAGGGASGS